MRLFLLLFFLPTALLGQESRFFSGYAVAQLSGWDKMMQLHGDQSPELDSDLKSISNGFSAAFSYYSQQNRIGYSLTYRFHQNYGRTGYTKVGWESHFMSVGVFGPIHNLPVGKTAIRFIPGLAVHFPQVEYSFKPRQVTDYRRRVDSEGIGFGADIGTEVPLLQTKWFQLLARQNIHYTPWLKIFNLHQALANKGVPEIVETTSFWEYRLGLALLFASQK